MGRMEGGMDGRARVFSFLLDVLFALIDRTWLGRNCYLLVVTCFATCCTCYLLLVPVIAQRIDAENENEKKKKEKTQM